MKAPAEECSDDRASHSHVAGSGHGPRRGLMPKVSSRLEPDIIADQSLDRLCRGPECMHSSFVCFTMKSY